MAGKMPKPTIPEASNESSETTSQPHESTTAEYDQTLSAEPLDESFRIPVTAQLSDHDSSDNSGSFMNNNHVRYTRNGLHSNLSITSK